MLSRVAIFSALPVYGVSEAKVQLSPAKGPPKAVGGAIPSQQKVSVGRSRSSNPNKTSEFNSFGLGQKKEAPPTTLRVVPPPRKRGGPNIVELQPTNGRVS